MDLLKALLGYEEITKPENGKEETDVGHIENGKPHKKENENAVVNVKTYSPEVTNEIEFRKRFKTQYSAEFIESMQEGVEFFCKRSYYDGYPVTSQAMGESLQNRSLYYPMFCKTDPLNDKISGVIEYMMQNVHNGEEEFFGNAELVATVMGENNKFFITNFIIDKIETDAPFDVEIRLSDSTDEGKQFQWVTWTVDKRPEVRSQRVDPIDAKKYPYICTSVDPSLINNLSADPNKCMNIRDTLWCMYLGDKNPDYFTKLFDFVRLPKQPKSREEFDTKYSLMSKTKAGPMAPVESEEEYVAYIKKTFETYLLMMIVKSSLKIDDKLRRAVEDSIIRSSHDRFRMEGKQAEKVLKIATHNIRKTERKDLFLSIRAFDHHIIRKAKIEEKMATRPQRSLIPSMEISDSTISGNISEKTVLYNIRINYTLYYRREDTIKLLEKFEQDYINSLK